MLSNTLWLLSWISTCWFFNTVIFLVVFIALPLYELSKEVCTTNVHHVVSFKNTNLLSFDLKITRPSQISLTFLVELLTCKYTQSDYITCLFLPITKSWHSFRFLWVCIYILQVMELEHAYILSVFIDITLPLWPLYGLWRPDTIILVVRWINARGINTHIHFKKRAQTIYLLFNVVTHTSNTHSTRQKHALNCNTVMSGHAYNYCHWIRLCIVLYTWLGYIELWWSSNNTETTLPSRLL